MAGALCERANCYFTGKDGEIEQLLLEDEESG